MASTIRTSGRLSGRADGRLISTRSALAPTGRRAGRRRAVRGQAEGQGEAASARSRRERRREERAASLTDLDTLLGFAAPAEPLAPPSRRRALALGVLGCLVAAGVVATTIAPPVATMALSAQAAVDYYESLPSTLPEQPLPTRSVMLAADGTRIAQFYSENRVPVRLEEVPRAMREAVIAIEDARFYEHQGVDVRGTGRALVNNLLGGSTQGGSTLTQQYVKNVLLNAADDDATRAEVTSQTSYLRKLREAKLALELEKSSTKDDILEGYLNIAYFGDGAYGVGTAAQRYFSKDIAEVSVAEAALLAGLVKNPTGYDPTDHPAAARARRDVVLGRMLALGSIDRRQYRRAVDAPVRLDVSEPTNGCTDSRYPFFCQWVKQQLESDPVFGRTQAQRNERLYRGGMTIETSLDPRAQDIAQAAVDGALGRDNRVAAAAVTIEPGTGRVQAMALNRTFGVPRPGRFDKTEVLLPVMPSFQPGSNFKPFTLAAALERGFDPATKIYAPPTYSPPGLSAPEGGFANFGSAATGNLDARQAVARSSNTWFVRLEEQTGVLNVASMAERLGITSLPRTGERAITAADAALTLGVYEVSPMEMAGAYATFAASGVHCTPLPIDAITGPDGGGVQVPDRDCHQVIPASVADTVASIMTETIDGTDPSRTGAEQSIGRPVAGKTGTTQDNAAVWFSGYTPQFATSVWVGDPRGGFAYPLQNFYAYGSFVPRAYGGLVAGPIWEEIMRGVHEGLPVQQFPTPSQTVTMGNVAPDVRGMSLDAAFRSLSEAGYQVRLAPANAERDEVLPADVVAVQVPAGGSYLGLDSTVTLTLSAGSDREVRLPQER